MLHTEHSQSVRNIDNLPDAGSSPDSIQFVYQAALDFLRRQYPVIAIATAIMIALGLVHIFTTPPTYSATADLMIDSSPIRLFQQQSMFPQMQVDTGTVESQVEILKSDNIALAVIKKLHLAGDPEFVGGGGGLIGTVMSAIKSLFSTPGPMSEATANHVAIDALHGRLQVERLGLTYIITIAFTSLDPNRAAVIANSLADAYIDDQLESKYQAARRAGTWLQERLGELRAQATTAERAVVAFKNKNNMVDAGGRTINEQQLAELNSQLVLAQSQTSDARAKVDRVQAILTSNSPDATVDATVADTLKDDVINKLRDQYLELARRAADWSAKYGADHLAVVNVRNQMGEIQGSIRAELQRIAETYKSDLEEATQREESVKKQLNQAVAQSQVTNEAQVSLRELQTNAESYQSLYNNFLQRYMESVQQQSFPITEARVISAASAPLGPSGPRTFRVLALATVAGLMFGAMAGAWREFADRVFRTRNQIEELLQVECIALVPLMPDLDSAQPQASRGSKFSGLGDGSGALKGFSDLQRGTKLAGQSLSNKIAGLRTESGFVGAPRDGVRDERKFPDPGQVSANVNAPRYGAVFQAVEARDEAQPDGTAEAANLGNPLAIVPLSKTGEAVKPSTRLAVTQPSEAAGAVQLETPEAAQPNEIAEEVLTGAAGGKLQDNESSQEILAPASAEAGEVDRSASVEFATDLKLETEATQQDQANTVLSELLHVVNTSGNVKTPDRRIREVAGAYAAIVESPFSAFAEAIRSVKMAVDLNPTGGDGKIIGFTSSVPNEGKSTVTVAVARLTAQTGARTLLVDCDLKNPSVSRLLAPRTAAGLLEVLRGQTPLEDAIWTDDATKLEFLPVALKARLAQSSEILASEKTRKFFEGLRQHYDYIFMDFSPLMPIVDVRGSTRLVDGFVYIVEWGKTRTDHVQNALRSARGVYEHLLGVVLNKVDLKSLGRYDGHGGSYYHHGDYYHRYGYTDS
jgi:capsular exopolysaccharide synthesis family protein